jgi:hypothetical protein
MYLRNVQITKLTFDQYVYPYNISIKQSRYHIVRKHGITITYM